MHHSSMRRALATVFQISFQRPSAPQQFRGARRLNPSHAPGGGGSSLGGTRGAAAPFSTSAALAARKQQGGKGGKGGGGGKKGKKQFDARITLIRYHLHHPTQLTPRPLRFSRTRHLRHWTIHRAWQLFRAQLKQARQRALERQYNAMAAACEELRTGAGDAGRLFRRSMMKTAVWSTNERGGGVPIEYARGLVDWVASSPSTGGSAASGNVAATAGGGGGGIGKARIWDSTWKRS